ncbi:hypothetical protein ACHHYP_06047 [Achlya hypogyna]|uniref:glucan endo-1,3-beta-D-glucosidase n=1 Tax=Achlya hypogyna TaxID=1202772 RepID=A0A1V9YVG6_ACHHY|nr:hypothetical protein ACHHYP_06047 [Achlya hypogyna]
MLKYIALAVFSVAFSAAAPIRPGACYSPFHLQSYPLVQGQVLDPYEFTLDMHRDFNLMQPLVGSVRTYYSNYYGIDIAPIAAAHNVPLYVGVYMTTEDWYTSQVESAIMGAVNYPSTVKAILVGNENVAPYGTVSPEYLINQINYIRSEVSKRSNGTVNVKVGTSQRVTEWIDGNANILKVADACDVVGVNIYPFFSEGYSTADPTGILDGLWNKMLSLYPADKLRLTETGYSTNGSTAISPPPAVPGLANAIQYYNALTKWQPKAGGGDAHWYTFFDLRADDTTQPADYEKYFGYFMANGTAKAANFPLCTIKKTILSEWNGGLYVNTIQGNTNEKFTLLPNAIGSVSSGNGCLTYSAASNSVSVTPCSGAANQAWKFDATSKRVVLPAANVCLVSNRAVLGASPTVAPCNAGAVSQYFDNCANVQNQNYVQLVTKRNAYVFEYYNNLYVGAAADDRNHLFVYNAATKTLQAQSNGQCLDAYQSGNSYQLHTYACDGSNGNQKWIIDSANRKVKHAVHPNLCLDVDPTSPTRSAQVWTCYPNSDNQVISVVPY